MRLQNPGKANANKAHGYEASERLGRTRSRHGFRVPALRFQMLYGIPTEDSHAAASHVQGRDEVQMQRLRLCHRGEGGVGQTRPVQAHQRTTFYVRTLRV